MKNISIIVNGKQYSLEVDGKRTLADVLRKDFFLTGTKIACNKGHCGSCNVIIDGELVRSCVFPASGADGKSVLTIEGLASEEGLHPIQKAFIEAGAVQCGYCTPGMILAAKALLDRNPDPTEQQAKESIKGNLCRCTGYVKIIEAILLAAEKLRSRKG